jgi:hypothetical protein
MHSDLTKPGFTQLKLCSIMHEDGVDIFCEQCGLDYFMSSERTKLWLLGTVRKIQPWILFNDFFQQMFKQGIAK